MVRALRRTGLALLLPALVAVSTLVHWLAARSLHGLWIMPDEAIYGERALALWHHGHVALVGGEGAGYGVLYPALAGLPLSVGRIATGYASLKLLQALTMSLVAVPVFFYGRRYMRPAYALLAALLALASPLLLYSGFLMTEVLAYPLGALALLTAARAVETATLRDQAITLAAIAAAILTRVQSVVLVLALATAVLLDALVARDPRRLRRFTPVWVVVTLGAAVVLVLPGAFGAYAGTIRGSYPLGDAAGLVLDHLAYFILSTAVVPVAVLTALVVETSRRSADRATRALVLVTGSAVVLVVLQVGLFAARFAPHLVGRDLALLPPTLYVVFALWLDRGAPRKRAVALPVALTILALLTLTPWNRLVDIDALPDTFGLVFLYRLGAANAAWAVAAVTLVGLALFVGAGRRWLPVIPVLMVGFLVVSTAVAAKDTIDRAGRDQRNLVGTPPNWIQQATQASTAYLYDGELYWNGVWQVSFWNPNVTDVVSIAPSRVPGPLAQRIVHLPPTGRLPIRERFIVATDAHAFVGTRIAHLTQVDTDQGGLTLWQLAGPPRLTTTTLGIKPNGDMTEPGFVRAYDCAGGQLDLTLLPKSTSIVTLRLDGRVVQRAHIGGLSYWNGTVFVPPSPSPRSCVFGIDGQNLLGSTQISFVHR